MDTKALRQKILDLAIRGKLVPQDPNDEPAEVLLKRIREQKQQMLKEGKLKKKDIKNDTIIFKGEDNLHYEKFQDGTVKCIEDEIPFEVPEGWCWCRLPVITTDIFAGGDKPDVYETCLTESCKIPIYSNGMENEGLYGYTNKPRVTEPSITISARGTIGFCCVRETPFVPIVRLITITPSKEINLYYLKTVFESLIETGEGSSIPQLTVPGIKPKLIPIPPVNEQIRLQNKLNQILNYIVNISFEKDELQNLLQIVKSKILNLAIRGKLVPQNPNDEPASVLLNRIHDEKEELIKQGNIKRDKKESVIFKGDDNSYYEKVESKVHCINEEIPFDLPEGWNFIRLKCAWELVSGRDLSPSDYNSDNTGIPYITGASNFENGHVSLVRFTAVPQVLTYKGDLLLTCKGTIGEIALNNFGEAHIARQIMAIRNIYNLNVEFLSLCIEHAMSEIKQAAKGLIPGISREDILNLIIPIPPEKHQKEIVRNVHDYLEKLNTISHTLN